MFCKTVKLFLLNKVMSTQKVTLIDKLTLNDADTLRVLNTFFSNIVSYLKIPDYNNCGPSAENIQESVLKTIAKFKHSLSILTIGEVLESYDQQDHFKMFSLKTLVI